MDIKSKNNKKISLLIVVIIAGLFAAAFMLQYPKFKKEADLHYRDVFQSEDFLRQLYMSNYVLYKDIMEKMGETDYSYEELYLGIEKTSGAETNAEKVENNNDDIYTESYINEVRSGEENIFASWEAQVMSNITQQLDYCVIDEKTGQIIKNTGKNIEALGNTVINGEKIELPYVYYVKVSYDSIGNLDKVSVMDSESDTLLKEVQQIMQEPWTQIEPLFESGNEVGEQIITFGYDEYGTDGKKITFKAGAPKAVTFIYAMTKEQKAKMTDGLNAPFSSRWEEKYAYYQSGVMPVYMVMLGIITLLIFILMHSKWYELHRIKAVRIPLGVILILGIINFGIISELIIELVNNTNRGYLENVYNRYFEFLPLTSYPIITGTVNFIFMFLVFLFWIYLINSVGEIFALGIKGFLKDRSIIMKSGLRLGRQIRCIYSNLKEELLHVNLGNKITGTIHKVLFVNFIVLAVICIMWIFGWIGLVIYSVLLYYILNKYIQRIQQQYSKLLKATGSIAEGNLNTVFDEDLGIFESYKEELYKIQEGFRKAVDEEVKSQRMKTELITNVSHDLKTPLTAICTYVDLLKEDNITEAQKQEYIEVLEKKSIRLKTLIEDLFEVSKANSKNVTVNLVDVDLCNLMRQVYLEYEDKIKEANLTFRFRIPEEKIILSLDSQKTYRIFENLYINIIKYAMPGTRVYIDVEPLDEKILVELKNMSVTELNVAPEELSERFVRGDSSRNTEGSGLGLAIAKSFTELQGGSMEITIDGDLFKVTLTWNHK